MDYLKDLGFFKTESISALNEYYLVNKKLEASAKVKSFFLGTIPLKPSAEDKLLE